MISLVTCPLEVGNRDKYLAKIDFRRKCSGAWEGAALFGAVVAFWNDAPFD